MIIAAAQAGQAVAKLYVRYAAISRTMPVRYTFFGP